MKMKYNFSYEHLRYNPESQAKALLKRTSDKLINQTSLVESLLAEGKDGFSFEDINNYCYYHCHECGSENVMVDYDNETDKGYRYTCKDCGFSDNDEPTYVELFQWFAFDADSLDIAHLRKSTFPYIENEYGVWVGREDFGQSLELQFLPDLCNALYNTELTEEDYKKMAE